MVEILSGFIIGILGSVHCVGMCGPLALILPIEKGNNPAMRQILYHSGRIVSYASLGLLMSALGVSLRNSGMQEWLSITTGIVLILIFIFVKFKTIVLQLLSIPYQKISKRISINELLQKSRQKMHFLFIFGLINGLLPCGLVYVALAAALNTSSILSGVLFMACFGLGTVPLLSLLIQSKKLMHFFSGRLLSVGTLILALLFILRGSGIGIPYISPNLKIPDGCCSHK